MQEHDVPAVGDGPAPGEAPDDARVEAALRRLRGEAAADIGADLDVSPSLVDRWAEQFAEAGREQLVGADQTSSQHRIDRLLGLVAHELRTPLAVERGWLRLLNDGNIHEDELPEAVDQLTRSVTRLQRFVEDLLDTAGAGLGRLELDREPTDLAALARAIAERVGADVDVDATPAHALVDRTRVLRALHHLTRVARAGDPGGQLRITTRTVGRWAEVAITRTDVTLPFATVHAALEPFEGDAPLGNATLGAYLARALVVAHGGHLGARAEEPGTTFWFRLPHHPMQDETTEGES